MKRVPLGAYLKYKNKICQVIGIVENRKVLFLREVGVDICKTCGRPPDHVEVEESPNFQENAGAIETLVENHENLPPNNQNNKN